jgi:DNA polymerase III epsilon subunit-like protein
MFLAFDVETGGFDPQQHSLLTIGLVAADLEKIHGELELKVKHKKYNVQPRAMEVNGIDLVEHDKEALTPKQVLSSIHAFLDEHFPRLKRIETLAHNISFDRGFLEVFCQANGSEGERLGDRLMPRMCTLALGIAMRDSGLIDTRKVTLRDLGAATGIQVEEDDLHQALADARLACQLYQAMTARMKAGMAGKPL